MQRIGDEVQYFDIPSQRPNNWDKYFRRAVVILLVVLAIVVVVSALFSSPTDTTDPTAPPPQAPTVDQAHMVEQRVTLTNGTTVTCIFFPSPFYGGSCDWSRSLRGDR